MYSSVCEARDITLPGFLLPTRLRLGAVENLRDDLDGLDNRRAGAVEEFVPVRENDFPITDRSQLEPSGQRFEDRRFAPALLQVVSAGRDDQEIGIGGTHRFPGDGSRMLASLA